MVDPSTIVRNLKSSKVELREKIFVDKPVHKQLEITMEEKQVITATSTYRKQSTMTGGGYFGKDIQNAGGMPAASYMGGGATFDTGTEPPDDKEERK